MLEEQKQIEEIVGAVEPFRLVNNYGFKKEGLVICHVTNVYGSSVDFWEINDITVDSFQDVLEKLRS